MIVLLIGNKTLYKMKLPASIEGSFVLSDPKTKSNLLNIDAEDNNWVLCDNPNITIKDKHNQIVRKTVVKNDDYFFVEHEKQKNIIYFINTYDETLSMYKVKENTRIVLGKDKNSNIIYSNAYIQPSQFALNYNNGEWELEQISSSYVYLNDKLIQKSKLKLNCGDQLFIYGLKICVLNGYIYINNPLNEVTINTPVLEKSTINVLDTADEDETEVNEEDLYTDDDYYFNTPRLRRFNETYELSVATPPAKQEPPEQNLLLTLGPALTMGLVSAITAFTSISKVINGSASFKSSWTTLITPVVSLAGSLLWPNLSRRFQKKAVLKKEKIRKEKYRKYIEEKRAEIEKEKINQTAILKEGLISLQECYATILNKKRTLWERKINQKDFLTIRVGTGDRPLDMNVNWNEDEFVIERDPLIDEAGKMVEEAKMLRNVPIGYSFFDKKATALMGDMDKVRIFTNNMLLQLMSFHSYDELKIVVFTNDENKKEWDSIRTLPHLFSNDKSIRFFGSNEDDQKEISNFLEQEFINRATNKQNVAIENENETDTYSPYYLIITDDYMKIRRLGICNLVMQEKADLGFGFVIIEKMLSHLPSKCINFIMIDKNYSGILRNELNDYYQQDFKEELDDSFDLQKCSEVLSNIPIEFESDTRYLPTSLSFLEMYGVGKIEQLNIFNRWRMNDPTKSLRAPIGVNDQGNLIYLDLHEKYSGPHGLIAGTTGSGKSEFIITYILSMCANYSPNEVAFILIDYKGGGLAGAFENKKTGVRLPHLAGTITNLDKNELNRTLVSIQSELTRRQAVFNDARDELGESTIDIYKYQKFFREGRLNKPMPHLFIICDEFAELKQQQPDFMDNLISAARIGRSLGVHLILATQKPSGVVNDQIWSNTKFRVCLKVANPGDSNEVIKCPDAAEIKNAGRFILQVGQNEIFVLGQSGWAGANYTPNDIVKQEYDRSIVYIDEAGNVIKSVEGAKTKKQINATGDELSNILKYITELAKKENLKSDNLWLDSIPKDLKLIDVLEKYPVDKTKVSAIIGEYDDPSNQKQGLLSLPLYELHNTMVYGLTASNRETFIRTMICSTSSIYSSEDVNFYILDFGSESFKIFNKFPHVGGVVFQSETDKIDKLFKMLDEEIITRKNLFVDYNGDYDIYLKSSGKKLPLYVVVINNYDIFKEQFMSYEELLLKLLREGKRYGILFTITTTSQSGLFSRFLKSFDDEYVLDMNDKDGYADILGRLGNIYPADAPGRGLFKRNNEIYEYQVAQISDEENTVETIKNIATELQKTNKYSAKQIPVLPDVLTLDMIMDSNSSLKNLPVGMEKETLNTAHYNFASNKALLISTNELENLTDVTKYLLQTFIKLGNIVPMFFDFTDEFESIKPYCSSYISSNFESYIENITKFIDEKIVNTQYTAMIVIAGLEKFKDSVDSSKINEFIEKIKKTDNCKLICVDTQFAFKKLTFEPWYANIVSGNNAIWVGSGIMDQAAVKVSTFDKKYSVKLDNDFGWLVKNGEGILIKLVNGDDHEE